MGPRSGILSSPSAFRLMADGKFGWPRGGGVRRKGRQRAFSSGVFVFSGGSSEGERKDRKLTAFAARGMEVRSKEELPDCEGLWQKWSREPEGR